MRAPLHLIRTGCTAIIAGALTFALAAGGASSAAELRDGSFADDLAYATPSGMSPAPDTALALPGNPLSMSWDPIPGATSYEVQVALRGNAATPCTSSATFMDASIKLKTTTPETGWVPDLMGEMTGKALNTGSYCWRLRAAGESAGPWSAPSSFSVDWSSKPTDLKFFNDTDGSIPRLTTDPDFATGSAKTRDSGYLVWSDVPGATGYDVQVSRSSGFPDHNVILSTSGMSANTISLPTIVDEDGYYWRVRTVSANGQRGAWSEVASFKVERFDSTWTGAAGSYPAYDANVDDALIGWNPVPGAAYYEVQTASSASCFWDDTRGQMPSPFWGESAAVGGSRCRLSSTAPEERTTINNWASARTVISEEVRTTMQENCDPSGAGACALDLPLGANGNKVFWRVRPVWQAKAENESFWDSEGVYTAYGAWLQDESAGFQRPNRFTLDRSTVHDAVTPAAPRCTDGSNPTAGGGCLRLMDGSLSVGNPAANSTSMQLPLLRWGSVPGRGLHEQPGSFYVQIASDPFFNRIVFEDGQSVGATRFGVEHSYSLRESLPDNSDGYWWRVVPCSSGTLDDYCDRYYYEGASGVSALVRASGFNDGAQPRAFSKSVSMVTKSANGFGGTTPLLLVASAGASTPAQWANGVQGAESYQFQLSRTPHFSSLPNGSLACDGETVLCSSSPRIHPAREGAKGTEPLDAGVWYWRARAMDRDGRDGTWSDVATFESTLPAPTVAASSEKSGPGVVVRWNPVAAATWYEVEYSTDSSFAGASKGTTSQLAFRLPGATAGTYYWRVRALLGTSEQREPIPGIWSDGTAVSVVPATKLRYGIAKPTVTSGAKATIEGQLLVAGAPANGRQVQLQRKTVACNASGSYVALAKSNTGGGEGVAKIPAKVLQNACYRLAYVGDKVVYSAPFSVGATPVIKFKVKKKTVKRKAKSCASVTSNRPVNGKVTYQYRKGKNAQWADASSAKVKNLKKSTLCFVLPKAGKFEVRASFSDLKHPKQGWTQYEPTTAAMGTIKVNNVWIKKSSKKSKR